MVTSLGAITIALQLSLMRLVGAKAIKLIGSLPKALSKNIHPLSTGRKIWSKSSSVLFIANDVHHAGMCAREHHASAFALKKTDFEQKTIVFHCYLLLLRYLYSTLKFFPPRHVLTLVLTVTLNVQKLSQILQFCYC